MGVCGGLLWLLDKLWGRVQRWSYQPQRDPLYEDERAE